MGDTDISGITPVKVITPPPLSSGNLLYLGRTRYVRLGFSSGKTKSAGGSFQRFDGLDGTCRLTLGGVMWM